MDIRQLYDSAEAVCLSIPGVESFKRTTPYESWNERTVKFASMAFTVESVERTDEYTGYTFIVYYGDRLLNDMSNFVEIQADSEAVIKRFLKGMEGLDGVLEVVPDYTIEFFRQKFDDILAGGYATVTIRFANNECEEYD